MPQFKKMPNLTVEEYLALEEREEVRHEYVNGRIFAMSGASDAHNVICSNLHVLLHPRVKGSGCMVYINDMKVRIETANSFYYPDIMVTCEPFEAKSVYKRSPVLIIEVLSPSTSRTDRREKLVAYQQLSSLKQYLIVHQSRYRIEMHRKDEHGQWEMTILGKNDVVLLSALPEQPEISAVEIYDGIELVPIVEEEEEDYELGRI
jgi:Uma2 family endonuclease